MTVNTFIFRIVFLQFDLGDHILGFRSIFLMAKATVISAHRQDHVDRIRIVDMGEAGAVAGFAGQPGMEIGFFDHENVIVAVITYLSSCINHWFLLIINKAIGPVMPKITKGLGDHQLPESDKGSDQDDQYDQVSFYLDRHIMYLCMVILKFN